MDLYLDFNPPSSITINTPRSTLYQIPKTKERNKSRMKPVQSLSLAACLVTLASARRRDSYQSNDLDFESKKDRKLDRLFKLAKVLEEGTKEVAEKLTVVEEEESEESEESESREDGKRRRRKKAKKLKKDYKKTKKALKQLEEDVKQTKQAIVNRDVPGVIVNVVTTAKDVKKAEDDLKETVDDLEPIAKKVKKIRRRRRRRGRRSRN
eukprot:397791_1